MPTEQERMDAEIAAELGGGSAEAPEARGPQGLPRPTPEIAAELSRASTSGATEPYAGLSFNARRYVANVYAYGAAYLPKSATSEARTGEPGLEGDTDSVERFRDPARMDENVQFLEQNPAEMRRIAQLMENNQRAQLDSFTLLNAAGGAMGQDWDFTGQKERLIDDRVVSNLSKGLFNIERSWPAAILQTTEEMFSDPLMLFPGTWFAKGGIAALKGIQRATRGVAPVLNKQLGGGLSTMAAAGAGYETAVGPLRDIEVGASVSEAYAGNWAKGDFGVLGDAANGALFGGAFYGIAKGGFVASKGLIDAVQTGDFASLLTKDYWKDTSRVAGDILASAVGARHGDTKGYDALRKGLEEQDPEVQKLVSEKIDEVADDFLVDRATQLEGRTVVRLTDQSGVSHSLSQYPDGTVFVPEGSGSAVAKSAAHLPGAKRVLVGDEMAAKDLAAEGISPHLDDGVIAPQYTPASLTKGKGKTIKRDLSLRTTDPERNAGRYLPDKASTLDNLDLDALDGKQNLVVVAGTNEETIRGALKGTKILEDFDPNQVSPRYGQLVEQPDKFGQYTADQKLNVATQIARIAQASRKLDNLFLFFGHRRLTPEQTAQVVNSVFAMGDAYRKLRKGNITRGRNTVSEMYEIRFDEWSDRWSAVVRAKDEKGMSAILKEMSDEGFTPEMMLEAGRDSWRWSEDVSWLNSRGKTEHVVQHITGSHLSANSKLANIIPAIQAGVMFKWRTRKLDNALPQEAQKAISELQGHLIAQKSRLNLMSDRVANSVLSRSEYGEGARLVDMTERDTGIRAGNAFSQTFDSKGGRVMASGLDPLLKVTRGIGSGLNAAIVIPVKTAVQNRLISEKVMMRNISEAPDGSVQYNKEGMLADLTDQEVMKRVLREADQEASEWVYSGQFTIERLKQINDFLSQGAGATGRVFNMFSRPALFSVEKMITALRAAPNLTGKQVVKPGARQELFYEDFRPYEDAGLVPKGTSRTVGDKRAAYDALPAVAFWASSAAGLGTLMVFENSPEGEEKSRVVTGNRFARFAYGAQTEKGLSVAKIDNQDFANYLRLGSLLKFVDPDRSIVGTSDVSNLTDKNTAFDVVRQTSANAMEDLLYATATDNISHAFEVANVVDDSKRTVAVGTAARAASSYVVLSLIPRTLTDFAQSGQPIEQLSPDHDTEDGFWAQFDENIRTGIFQRYIHQTRAMDGSLPEGYVPRVDLDYNPVAPEKMLMGLAVWHDNPEDQFHREVYKVDQVRLMDTFNRFLPEMAEHGIVSRGQEYVVWLMTQGGDPEHPSSEQHSHALARNMRPHRSVPLSIGRFSKSIRLSDHEAIRYGREVVQQTMLTPQEINEAIKPLVVADVSEGQRKLIEGGTVEAALPIKLPKGPISYLDFRNALAANREYVDTTKRDLQVEILIKVLQASQSKTRDAMLQRKDPIFVNNLDSWKRAIREDHTAIDELLRDDPSTGVDSLDEVQLQDLVR